MKTYRSVEILNYSFINDNTIVENELSSIMDIIHSLISIAIPRKNEIISTEKYKYKVKKVIYSKDNIEFKLKTIKACKQKN